MNTWINIPRSKVQVVYLVSTEACVLLELMTIIFPDERLMTNAVRCKNDAQLCQYI